MKTERKSSHNDSHPSVYAIRPCPQCGAVIYGMPGGRDASCTRCGYKDPCCSD